MMPGRTQISTTALPSHGRRAASMRGPIAASASAPATGSAAKARPASQSLR